MKEVREFLLNTLNPSISRFFEEANPELFQQWQGNCCRQTSLIANYYLRMMLLDMGTGYKEVQSWIGKFEDYMFENVVHYDHAWVYCIHEDPTKNLLVDIARTMKNNIVIFSKENKFPNLPGYENQTLLEKERLDFSMFYQTEYYSHKTGPEIVDTMLLYESKYTDLICTDGEYHNKMLAF